MNNLAQERVRKQDQAPQGCRESLPSLNGDPVKAGYTPAGLPAFCDSHQGEPGGAGSPFSLCGGPGAEPPVILNLRQTATSCEPKYLVIECSCGPTLVKSGCMRKDCEECADAVGLRRSGRVYDRLQKGAEGRSVLYTVLTVPPDLRGRFVSTDKWRKALRKIWKTMKASFGALYGVENSHPTGENLEVFAPHANFLWVQRPGFRPYIDVDELRAAWASIIGAEGPVDVHHQYVPSGDVKKVAHRCRYSTRSFPGWGWWIPSMRWYGTYPRKMKKEPPVCHRCGERFRYGGVATDDEVSMWNERPWEFRPLYDCP